MRAWLFVAALASSTAGTSPASAGVARATMVVRAEVHDACSVRVVLENGAAEATTIVSCASTAAATGRLGSWRCRSREPSRTLRCCEPVRSRRGWPASDRDERLGDCER